MSSNEGRQRAVEAADVLVQSIDADPGFDAVRFEDPAPTEGSSA